MRIELATEAGSAARANEDFVLAAPGAFVVLDGVTPGPRDPGCTHGVVWYVRSLGVRLLAAAAGVPDRPLADCLADAVAGTAAAHGGGCDLSAPGTPQATVAVGRLVGGRFEYLVLADCTVVLETGGGPVAVTDDRVERAARGLRLAAAALPEGSAERAAARERYAAAVEGLRNRPGGFWTAAADPAVAGEALTGSVPASGLRAVAAMSDGASRFVDLLGLGDWSDVMRLLASHGPAELLSRVRRAEAGDPERRRWRRGKVSDDATVVHAVPGASPGFRRRGAPA
ncbi:integrase [Streptacidiphilus sp. ASG 303]|uniref:integrase n=1 Tax=Streptacidiphilus sp. ASG 303 TaxID=2896847 RepID=UPI001E3B3924|nr:integrase [Streptacidiphilus sp. ASG 303]MCD0482146.1 integrase [Streptacidiphilus sp. ASG 303]